MGDTVHGDKYGGDRVHGPKIVFGSPPLVRPSPRRPAAPRVVLLMSANPDREQPLRLDVERREIDLAVRHAEDRLVVRTADAIRLDDLQQVLLRHEPTIAHFSGHGSASEGIVVIGDDGRAAPVPPAALANLFRILGNGLRCVVLNACFTEEQARAIVNHVPYVVGMRSRVLDDTAIRFAAGFYQGIAHARSILDSFELGRHRLELHRHPDAYAPRLIAAPGAADRPVIRPRSGDHDR